MVDQNVQARGPLLGRRDVLRVGALTIAGSVLPSSFAQTVPTATPATPGDVAASIYQALGIDPETLLYDSERRPHPVLPQGRPIPGLFL